MKKVTLEQLAHKLNVSKVAVFKALNNKAGVSDELRSRATALAEEMGYTKKSEPTVNHKKFIYLVKKDFFLTPSEQFYSTLFYFLSTECEKHDCSLQIMILENNSNLIMDLEKSGAAGVFVAGPTGADIYKHRLPLPAIFLDFYDPNYPNNYIYSDNYHLAYSLTLHLIEKGHTKIGFVGDIHSTGAIADRFFGYLKALTERNLAFDSDFHINSNIEHQPDYATLNTDKLPTAFVCHCDAAAQKLYISLSVASLSVPDQISVVSFDNTPLCDNLIPGLTSLGPNKEYMARKAFSSMCNVLSAPQKTVNLAIKSVLTERGSVKSL